MPGVTGSCIFDKSAGALCSEFKADLPADLSESVGIHFVRLIQMGTMNKLNIKSAHFRFDKYSVVGLPLDSGAILLAICDSDANCSLVASTAAMLVEDIGDDLTYPDAEYLDEAGGSEEKSSAGEAADALKVQFEEIGDALADAIGPVAGMVMADYISKWKQAGPVESSRLGELVTMLVEEIGDSKLVDDFKAKMKHFS